jgi:hypothetical protein
MRKDGGVAGPQPMSTVLPYTPKKLWRPNSIFNLWFHVFTVPCFGFKRYLMFLLDLLIVFLKGDFFFFMYVIQQCFICRPSNSTVSEEAGIEPRSVATLALTATRSNHSTRSHPHLARSHPLVNLLSLLESCFLILG